MLLTEGRSRKAAKRIQTLVEAALKKNGVSARKASIDVVGHDGLIRDIRAGRIPAADRLDALFEYLGLPAVLSQSELPEPQSVMLEAREKDTPFEGPPAVSYLPFPWHRHMKQNGTTPVAIRNDWLEMRGLDPASLSVIEVQLPSDAWSEPQIGAALLDEAAKKTGTALWGWRELGHAFIGRTTWPSGSEPAIIENADHRMPPRLLTGATRNALIPLGKVVWLGRTIS